jgi:hypothetical protein
METSSPPPFGSANAGVEQTLQITQSLRNVANALMERAHQARDAGEISLDDFFAVSERYQEIINQANVACYEAAERLPAMDEHIGPIEAATKDLEHASIMLAKITDVLAVAGQILQAVSSLVLAILNPQPAAFGAVALTIASAAQGIQGQLSH